MSNDFEVKRFGRLPVPYIALQLVLLQEALGSYSEQYEALDRVAMGVPIPYVGRNIMFHRY